MAGLAGVNRAITRVERAFGLAAGTALFAIMAVASVDVALRYLFRAPLSWSYDVVSNYLVALMFFFIASETFRRNGHVAVDIVYLRARPQVQRWLRLLIAILSIPVLLLTAMLAAGEAASAWRNGEMLVGSRLWPAWIAPAVAAAGLGLLVARLVLDAVALAAALRHRHGAGDEVPGESPERCRPHAGAEIVT